MHLFLVVVLILIGYFIFFSWVMAQSNNKIPISTIALISVIVYGCGMGILVLTKQYFGALGMVLYVFLILYSLSYWSKKIYDAFQEKIKISWGAGCALAAYILAVLYITLIMRESGREFEIQMRIFHWMSQSATKEGADSFQHMFLNFAMFFPIGVIFMFLSESKTKKILPGISLGILISTLIETGQLLLKSGKCDIDDIIANTLGTMAGVLLIRVWEEFKKSRKKKWKRILR